MHVDWFVLASNTSVSCMQRHQYSVVNMVVDVLNRCTLGRKADSSSPTETPDQNEANTLKVMMYIFPRQFRLHNVFTSQVDKTKTSQKFQDYTIREEEIATTLKPHRVKIKIPKRLRGAPRDLVERLQVRHSRCSYAELLRHYCPSPLQAARRNRGNAHLSRNSVYHSQSLTSTESQQNGLSQGRPRSRKHARKTPQPSVTLEYDNITDLSCPMAKVSAFCQSVLSTLVPDGFWGEGDTMQHNKAMILSKVDRFIKMRRFETLSLHEITQSLKVELDTFRCSVSPRLTGSRLPILAGFSLPISKGRKQVRQTWPSELSCFKSSCTTSSIPY